MKFNALTTIRRFLEDNHGGNIVSLVVVAQQVFFSRLLMTWVCGMYGMYGVYGIYGMYPYNSIRMLLSSFSNYKANGT